MARVDIVREVRTEVGEGWQLCLQWSRYRLDKDDVQYGYRFVWRRPDDGSLQAARGQARIPSLEHSRRLMELAQQAGWGERDGDEMRAAATRLKKYGCVVDFVSGYVGWPSKEVALKSHLTVDVLQDERIIREWSQ